LYHTLYHSLSRVVVPATLDYLCQCPIYKILVKVRNSKKYVLKIVSIIACAISLIKLNYSYQNFLYRGLLLTRKLLNQGFLLVKLKWSLRKFYDRHHDLVDRYEISVSQMTTIYSTWRTNIDLQNIHIKLKIK
jgi:hypothetical protein